MDSICSMNETSEKCIRTFHPHTREEETAVNIEEYNSETNRKHCDLMVFSCCLCSHSCIVA